MKVSIEDLGLIAHWRGRDLCLIHLLLYSFTVSLISVAPLFVAYGQPEVSSTVKSVTPAPSGIEYDPVHEVVYVTSERAGSVSVIDTNANTVTDKSIIVGSNPRGIAHDPVHNRMYVTNFGSNSVSVIDTNTNTVIGSPIIVGSNPYEIAHDFGHKRIYVTNSGNATISVIDTNTNTVIGSPIIVGNNPHGIAHDPVHNRMYVTNFGSNSVSVIDTNTNTEIGGDIRISSPLGIEYDFLNSKLYVTSITDNTVSAIDSRSNTLVGNPVYTGGNPRGLSFDHKNGKMFTTNHANGTVSAIQISLLHTILNSATDSNNNQISYRDQTTSTEITFTFSASATHLMVEPRFECKVDDFSFSKCSSPITYKDLGANQTHTFKVRAIDELGNVETPPKEYTWMILSPSQLTGRLSDICIDRMSHRGEINEYLNTNPVSDLDRYASYLEKECSINRLSDAIEDADTPVTNDNQLTDETYRDFTEPGILHDNTLTLNKERDRITQSENNTTLCQKGTQQTLTINESMATVTAYCEGVKNPDFDLQEREQGHLRETDTISRLEGNVEDNKPLSSNIPLALPY